MNFVKLHDIFIQHFVPKNTEALIHSPDEFKVQGFTGQVQGGFIINEIEK